MDQISTFWQESTPGRRPIAFPITWDARCCKKRLSPRHPEAEAPFQAGAYPTDSWATRRGAAAKMERHGFGYYLQHLARHVAPQKAQSRSEASVWHLPMRRLGLHTAGGAASSHETSAPPLQPPAPEHEKSLFEIHLGETKNVLASIPSDPAWVIVF